jgi:hypothetical protein
MRYIVKQFKQILITTSLLLWVVTAISQVKHKAVTKKPAAKRPESTQLKDFKHLAVNANVVFVFPPGLKEIPALNNEDFSFDYAMELPGREFEVWFQVKSQKADWLNYERLKNDPKQEMANPDSSYNEIGNAQAKAFTDEEIHVTKIPPDILARYNADAGKTFLLNLRDLPETNHYKYALLITLQKFHTSTIVAICLGNEKGAEFFKNINKVSKCLKFKP